MLLDKLRSLLLGKPAKEIMHPVFGKCILQGTYWECDTVVDGLHLTVCVETVNEEDPIESQVSFLLSSTSDVSKVLNAAGPLLSERYRDWFEQECPSELHEVFTLEVVTVPVDGIATNPWSFSFTCKTDPDGHLFTCYFENGNATHVSVDG